jgi:hypothetical protein
MRLTRYRWRLLRRALANGRPGDLQTALLLGLMHRGLRLRELHPLARDLVRGCAARVSVHRPPRRPAGHPPGPRGGAR